ncbi:hypothetical protein [Legionella bononiensis]|uniref:Transmembrane protein n=1 Tax=Legionella bononiensis TaxID=2793102 RepID=A0ABS1W9X5_9GAMM|nr:hypothetical protein [Legionella bononiensis]MBL7480643.1 hypothetical protein [Legionella bononiensis]MBL7526158.1 hypothetical protein [Legionella bononiensis]MBL7563347.1 hypothetical protein [Legionella bononiensis]
MKGNKLLRLVHLIFFMCCSNLLFSGSQPKFTIIPTVANGNIVQVSSIGKAEVTYLVTNKTKLRRSLVMTPITGISLIRGGVSNCADSFVLDPQQSCVLKLEINGSLIPAKGYFGGPIICKRNDNGSPDPFLCSEPSQPHSLNVSVISPGLGRFEFRQGGVPIPGNTIRLVSIDSGAIELFNSGTGIIQNITLSYPAGYFTSTCGSTLAPNQGCFLNYTIPPLPPSETLFIIANGLNASNSPQSLKVVVNPGFAHITNSTNGSVTQCGFLPNGTFSACNDSGVGNAFNGPGGIALNYNLNIAYVVNSLGGTVSRCVMNSNGNFVACTDYNGGSTPFVSPESITLNNAGTRAYVTNVNFVSVCSLDSNGAFIDCLNAGGTGVPLTAPLGIVLNDLETFAYISCCDEVVKCLIKSDGTFGLCVDSGPGSIFTLPNGITLNKRNSIGYVANQGSPGEGISLCAISGGNFTACTLFTSSLFQNPTAIELNNSENYAYVTDLSNVVLVCRMNANGGLVGCVDSGAVFNGPFGIALSR